MDYETVEGTNHIMKVMIGNEPHWIRIHEPEASDEQIIRKNDKEYTSVQGKIKIRDYNLQ